MRLLPFLMMAALSARVHFASNSEIIPAEETPRLDQNVSWLQDNRSAVVILEGHCDEWGDDTYNMELGDRRAREVKAYLIEKGVDAERIIMVVSYGETKPLAAGHDPESWRANRRVEFVLR